MMTEIKNWISETIKPHTFKKILEVGSYDVNGNIRDLFPPETYTGLDITPGPNVDIVGNGSTLPFLAPMFDLVVSTSALEHDKNFWITIPELKRVLLPGGLLIITCPTYKFEYHNPPDYYRFSKDSLQYWFPGSQIIENPSNNWFLTWWKQAPNV